MSRTTLRVTCIIGLALSSSVLILLIPSLFDANSQSNPLLMGALAVVALAFAAGTLFLGPVTREGDTR